MADTSLYKATCPVAGCTGGVAGAVFETPAVTVEQDAARAIADHFTTAHSLGLVRTVAVDPQFPPA